MRRKGEHKSLGLMQYQAKTPMGFSCMKNVRWEIDSRGRCRFVYRRRTKSGFSFETTVAPSGNTKQHLIADLRKFEEWNRLASEGIDPRRYNGKLIALPTFREVAEEWLQTQQNRLDRGGILNEKTFNNYRGRLKKHAFPRLGELSIDQITVLDVVECLKPVWHTDTGRRIRWLCEQVCLRAMGSGYVDKNFAQKEVVTALLSQNSPVSTHRRFIEVCDVPNVFENLCKHDSQVSVMVQLMLLSCIRVENVVGLEWSWIDLDMRQIVIPAIRTKTKTKDFKQPITDQIESLLVGQRDRTLGERYVFSNQKSRSGYVSPNLPSQWIRTQFNPKYGYSFQPSGLRGTFRRWADQHANAFPEAVIEETYMHAVKGIKSFYTDRELFEQKKPLLEAWNSYCVSST